MFLNLINIFALFASFALCVRDPKDIIISENETIILDLVGYDLNGNLPYIINNPYKEYFYINLTETFVIQKTSFIFTKDLPKSLKFLENSGIYLLLHENSLEIYDSSIMEYKILSKSKISDYFPEKLRNYRFYCHDVDEFLIDIVKKELIIIDCDIFLEDNQTNIEIMSVFFLNLGENPISLVLKNYEFVSDFKYDSSIIPRKLIYNFGSLYRYSKISDFSSNITTNNIEIWTINADNSSNFALNLLIILEHEQLESMSFFKENLLTMDLTGIISIYDVKNRLYNKTYETKLSGAHENLTFIEISLVRMEFQNRVIVLSNLFFFYLMLLPQSLSFVYNYQIKFNNTLEEIPLGFSQVNDYLLITFKTRIQVYFLSDTLDPEDPNNLVSFDYNILNKNESINVLNCVGCFETNTFALFLLSDEEKNPFFFNSLFSLIQITQRKLIITSQNTSNNPLFHSMRRFRFVLTMEGIESIDFHLIYWEFNDINLYYYTKSDLVPEFNTNKSLYLIDTAQIFIQNRDFIIGPLKEISIAKISPIASKFYVDDKSFYELEIHDLTNLEQISYFIVVATPKSYRILYQNKLDFQLTLKTCLWDLDYKVTECTSNKITNIYKKIRKSIRYKQFLIIQQEDEDFVFYGVPRLRESFTEMRQLQNVYCKDIYVEEMKNLLICINNNEFLNYIQIDSICQKGEDLFIVFLNVRYPFFMTITMVYTELMEQNCLVVLLDNEMHFLEVKINKINSGFMEINECMGNYIDLQIRFRNSLAFEKNDTNISVYFASKNKENNYVMIVIFFAKNQIKEFNLDDPFFIVFLRKYPLYSYILTGESFMNNEIFLCVKAKKSEKNKETVLLIFNITEPTSNLLKKSVDYPPNTSFINIFVMSNNLYEELNFVDSYHLSILLYPTILYYNENQQFIVQVLKKYNILGDISQELIYEDDHSNENNKSHLSYKISLQYTNPLVGYYIMTKIQVKVLLKDNIITSPIQTYQPPIQTIDKNSFTMNISNEIFQGPIENYRLEILNSSTNKIRAQLQEFMTYTREFSPMVNDSFLQCLENNGTLFLLTTARLSVLDLLTKEGDFFVVLGVYELGNKSNCMQMSVMPNESTIFLYCKQSQTVTIMHLSYEFKTIDKNFTYILINFVKKYEFSSFFRSFMSVMENPGKYLIFLAEDRVLEPNSDKKSLFFFTYPCKKNAFEVKFIGKLNDDKIKDSSFMTHLQDFQIITLKQISPSYSYIAILLLSTTKAMYVKVVIYGTVTSIHYVDIIEKKSLELLIPLEFLEYQYYKNFVFFNLRIVDCVIKENSPMSADFNANFSLIVGSNMHTFLYKFFLNEVETSFALFKIFRKFYSCENAGRNRPSIFKSFLGTFCERKTQGDEFSTKTYSYFLLYKLTDDFEISPITALPIYYDNYNLVFYENNRQIMLIIPCFLSLFTEYSLNSDLKIKINSYEDISNFNGNFMITAYNALAEHSLVVQVDKGQPNNNNGSYILIILLCSCIFIILVAGSVFLYRFYKNQKREGFRRNTQSIEREEVLKRKGFVKIDQNWIVYVNQKKKNIKKTNFWGSNYSNSKTQWSSQNDANNQDY